jgi:hypothetical protein
MRDDLHPSPDSPGDEVTLRYDSPSEMMTLPMRARCDWPVSRRDFVKGATAVFGVSTLTPSLASAANAAPPQSRSLPIALTVNGEHKQLTIDPRTSLA